MRLAEKLNINGLSGLLLLLAVLLPQGLLAGEKASAELVLSLCANNC